MGREKSSSTTASSHAGYAFAKGTQAAEAIRARARREQRQLEAAVRRAAVKRDGGCRADCGFRGSLASLHRHEEPPRSQGGNPGRIDHVVMLCPECHRARHGQSGARRLRLRVVDPVKGTNGPIVFYLSEDGLSFLGTRVYPAREWVTERADV